MKNKKLLACGTGLFLLAGLPYTIDVSTFEIPTCHIHEDIRLCVLADLHSTLFGRGQKQLRQKVDQIHPDMILMPGDMIDDKRSYEPAFMLFDGLRKYETFYVPGNHEMRMDHEVLRHYFGRMEEMGIHVLIDESYYDEKRGIEIAGLHSMGHHVDCEVRKASDLFHHDDERVLMSHSPAFADFYAQVKCDLVVCGHAHGGQWRLPFTHQGLYAPQEGILPKYTEGMHELGDVKMCISRGLNRSAYDIPRLYNNPEIVVIDLIREDV